MLMWVVVCRLPLVARCLSFVVDCLSFVVFFCWSLFFCSLRVVVVFCLVFGVWRCVLFVVV